LTGTSIGYSLGLWYHDFRFLSGLLYGTIGFLLTSFSRIHLGYQYPSDCLLTLPISILVISASHLLRLLDPLFGCPYSLINKDLVCYV